MEILAAQKGCYMTMSEFSALRIFARHRLAPHRISVPGLDFVGDFRSPNFLGLAPTFTRNAQGCADKPDFAI